MTDIITEICRSMWNVDGGGKDFRVSRGNHAVSEGYTSVPYRPFYPQSLLSDRDADVDEGESHD
jgi:hypothetical protein